MSDAGRAARSAARAKPELRLETYLAACRDKGATRQEDRAALFGMPRRTLLRYEKSEVGPRGPIMWRIATTLGCTIDELWPVA